MKDVTDTKTIDLVQPPKKRGRPKSVTRAKTPVERMRKAKEKKRAIVTDVLMHVMSLEQFTTEQLVFTLSSNIKVDPDYLKFSNQQIAAELVRRFTE